MSENKYFWNLVGGVSLAAAFTVAGLGYAVKTYKHNKLMQEIHKYPIETASLIPIPQNADLQRIFGYKTKDFSEDSDQVALARQIMGECSGCTKLEKTVVAFSVIHRAHDGQKWNGEGVKEAAYKDGQYSCFNKWLIEEVLVKDKYGNVIKKKNGEPLTKRVKRLNSRLACLKDPMKCAPKEFQEDLNIAEKVLAGEYEDIAPKVKFYFNHNTIAMPKWAKNLERVDIPGTIHWFYREKRK